ncbi:ABC-2 type transport system permease protein [Microbacterium endophyticum]|uniref:Transport permease protein n=1 Tax=Microbacterium endophyticum TaxID=1526412 RepID=A0A7W4V506_9MICO|nr:ABC transporter permease [Microbacterium endophyticum]MBB2976639.1 ABC-2 type transport system permease protein [Microbacterium endophyticum]NIK37478.1 ABC-2 type transport system permease protein [Microbacterium endophyticum]
MSATTVTRTLPTFHVFRQGIRRAGYEIRGYIRSPETIVFTFLFPIMLLGLFSVVFGGDGPTSYGPGLPEVSAVDLYLPSMLAAGILLSGLQNLAIDIAVERHNGTLKHLGGTPLSPVSYFLGKIGQVLVTAIAQAAVLLAFAVWVLGATVPTTIEAWATFAWVFLLGLVTSALLGIGISALPRSAKGATGVVIPIVLVLQFISGVYLFFWLLPEWLQNIANLFPLAWLAKGMRSVFLPADYATLEQSGEWGLGAIAAVLAIWLVVGLVLSRLTFRWIRRDA